MLSGAIGKTWIDKIELASVEPSEAATGGSDPVAELSALMEGEIAQSKAFQDALQEMARDLSAALPQDIREEIFGKDCGRLRGDSQKPD